MARPIRFAGAVLAGGRSRRMGADKAGLEVDGRAMADRVLDALRAAGADPVVVVGGTTPGLSAPTIADLHPGEGPVGGLVTVLDHELAAEVDALFVLSCDIPWVDDGVLHALAAALGDGEAEEAEETGQAEETRKAGEVDVAVAVTDRREPLCGLWRTTVRATVVDAFTAGERAMHRLLDRCSVREVPIEAASRLHNVNTPEDLEVVRRVGSTSVTIPEISVRDLAELGPDARVVDVREADEWVDSHVPYAVHVPLGTVPDRLDRFDGAPTYVICKAGGRSLRACEFAAAHGHDVVNVAGGMMAWLDAGLAVETGPAGGAGA